MIKIFTFIASAKSEGLFISTSTMEDYQAAMRKQCDLPSAKVEMVNEESWQAPHLLSVSQSEIQSKADEAMAGIRRFLKQKGISDSEIRKSLTGIRVVPVPISSRVFFCAIIGE